MEELLEQCTDDRIFNLTELGLQHEQQHQELLVTDIKYILGNNPLLPEYKKIIPSVNPPGFEINFMEVPAGVYEIGFSGEGFSFDNESPVHKVYVDSFSLANRLVTNREYLQFMEDDGYKSFQHWLMEGWEMVKAFRWEAPLYWTKIQGKWYEYTLGGVRPLMLNAPVTHISFYEADAYAKWAGKRLLTEFEWEVAAKLFNQKSDSGNFLEDGWMHPIPEKENEIKLLGNVWQWTYSAYSPYPGYAREEGALGEYNGKFMVNQMVLRGGSCATPKEHVRISYRNFFHPDKRWQFTGIRLANKD
jgi:ergothioneine biosynthesis protein EgtB